MAFMPPEDREKLESYFTAPAELRQLTPWAVAHGGSIGEWEWDWGDLECQMCQAVRLESDKDDQGFFCFYPDVDSRKFDLVMAKAADAVLRYVLANPEFYGLKRVSDNG